MKRLKNNGQEAIEFVLISSLVFIAALGTIMIFGNKLAAFFSGGSSSVVAASNQAAPTVDTSAGTQYKADYETELAYETVKVGGQELMVKEDGTVMFNVGGQTVNLAPSAMNYINTTMQTSGASGAEDIIKAITKIISEEKAKYPDSDVPVEMAFGESKRYYSGKDDTSAVYSGNAEVNTASLKVGNRILVVSNDQACEGNCAFTGTFIIDGTYDSNSKLYKAMVSSDAEHSPGGSFQAKFDMSNGFSFSDAKYDQKDNINSGVVSYNWSMDFSDSNKQFDI